MSEGRVAAFASRNRDTLLLVWLGLVLLLPHAMDGYLRGDGLHYAAVMKEMSDGGSWLTPTFAGEPYFNKPPLYFWFGAALFKVAGATTYVARLVGALPAILLLVANYHLVRRLVDARHALLASVVLGTSSVLVRNSGEPRLDAPLTLCLVLAIAVLVAARENRRLLPLFWLAVGLGLGLKGPGGLLPVLVVALWSLTAKRLWPWNEWRFWAGLVFVPVFVGPWLLANWAFHGERFLVAYGDDDLKATLLGEGASTTPIVKYSTDLVREWWPWIPFIVHGAWRAVRRWAKSDGTTPDALLLAWWAGVTIVVLSIQQPYSRYLFPVLPATSLLAADSLLSLAPRWLDRWLVPGLTGLLAAATLVLAVGPVNPHARGRPDLVAFEPVLRTRKARDPILCLGERIPRRLQGVAILYLDTTVELIDAAALRDRIGFAGAPIPVVVHRDEPPNAEGLVLRPLAAGDDFDLVEADLVR